MAANPPGLPRQFPCWCRAVYSFSGENKRDLGFIEGDLIECLNAGDGSWWMGRLRRDKRIVGHFPSNFVQVLENYEPKSRASSPMPDQSPSPNPFNPQPPEKTKSKVFRKPFQAYAAPDQAALERAQRRERERDPFVTTPAASNPIPIRQMNARAPSPRIDSYNSRTGSPIPPPHQASRAQSPMPPPHFGSSAPASAPYRPHARAASPGLGDSPPPPAPPPHRSTYTAPEPTSYLHQPDGRNTPSPVSPAHSANRHTPSPLRSAMDDVMSSLADMGSGRAADSPEPPIDPWSPEAFDQSYTRASRSKPSRPNTAMGIGAHSLHGREENHPFATKSRSNTLDQAPPQLSNYVQRMENRLSKMQTSNSRPFVHNDQPPAVPPKGIGYDRPGPSLAGTSIRPASSMTGNFSRPKSSMAVGRDDYNRPGSSRAESYPTYPRSKSSLAGSVKDVYERPVSSMMGNLARPKSSMAINKDTFDEPEPAVAGQMDRPKSSMAGRVPPQQKLRHRKSAFEVGRSLARSLTTKTNSTSSSSGNQSTVTTSSASTQMTSRSIMSGDSAGAFSSTSAGSLARRQAALYERSQSATSMRVKERFLGMNRSQGDILRPETPFTGISYHSSHASAASAEEPRAPSQAGWCSQADTMAMPPPPHTLKPKKSGFFKKMIESAKTNAAGARSSIAMSSTPKPDVVSKSLIPDGVTSIAGGMQNFHARDVVSDLGTSGRSNDAIDWVQVRRDVNRSNSLSRIERVERKERCQMMDYPAISPVDELYEGCDGDEGADGTPVPEPTNFQAVNYSLIDKTARFTNSLPPMTNPISLATGYICRPYRSDVQRLRAIFIWVSERVTWEEPFETDIDSRRVIQTQRGCPEESAILFTEMCSAVGIQTEVIRGYLKTPGEVPELGIMPRPNHFWNAVIIDGQWRFVDCSLASPTNPRRSLYSSCGGQVADGWWFLARPTEICWTHVPEQPRHQHICPPIAHEVLVALPCACPGYFKNGLQMCEYDTSLVRVEDLELVHIKFTVPEDIECVAEVEARAFERDADGDFFESGEVVKKRALAQAEWVGGQKRYTVKALLPGDEGQGILKIYAGKRGLMHSIKDIPHALALALPIIHTGDNPPFDFFTRHPTPHAQRHDLYVAQPQCQRLAINNTFVFAVRQHPSSLAMPSPNAGGTSPLPFLRPNSALSMTSSSAAGSNASGTAYTTKKPAKLAIQAPGGKILRLQRKEDRNQSTSQGNVECGDGGTWETIIKCGERGIWRGLVLADRSARWCVFAEWLCL